MLELVRSKTQNVTIIDKEKHKIKQIYIWIPMTTEFIMWTITTASIIPSFKFVFPQFTSSSCFILFTGLDELGKVACSQCMGIHSTAALTQRPWVCFPLKSWKFFGGGLICNCFNCNYHCDDHTFIQILTFIYVISIKFPSPRRKRSSWRNVSTGCIRRLYYCYYYYYYYYY